MTHHVAILHEDTLKRLYEISNRHENLVQKILTNLQPTVYRTIIRSLSRLDLVEVCQIYYMICCNVIVFKQFNDYYFLIRLIKLCFSKLFL